MEIEDRKVDVLYVVGKGSLFNNEELRFSLRMLSSNCKNVGRVIVSGYVPDFVGGEAIVVPHDDIHLGMKQVNILDNILFSIKAVGLRRRFLLSSDDHFIHRRCDLAAWPRYTRGKIYNSAEYIAAHGKPPGKYQQSVIATREILEKFGYPIEYTCWHGDTWLNPKYAEEVSYISRQKVRFVPLGYEPTLLFTNIEDSHESNPVPYERLTSDVKCGTYDDALNFAATRGCFSTSNDAWRGLRLLKWFRKTYPNKCEWER